MALRPVQKDFPIEAATDVAHIVRNGFLKTNAALLAAACNDLISWASYEAFGDPDSPAKLSGMAPSVEPGPHMSDEEVIRWLEAGGVYADPDPSGRVALIPIPALAVLRFALEVLLKLL